MTDQYEPPLLVAGNGKKAMDALNAKSNEVYRVPVDAFEFIEGFNPREDTPEYLAHIEQIAQSILANGFYRDKPISIFIDEFNKVKVTDGHSRVRGARRALELGAELETLPAVIKPKGTSMEDLTVALVTSNSGKHLTPFETGKVCKRLIDMGMDEKTIAKRFALGVEYVRDLLGLVASPKPIRDMVIAGEVSPTTAIKELNEHGSKAVERLATGLAKAKAEGKTKVTGKHLDKPKTFKLSGKIAKITGSRMIIILDEDVGEDLSRVGDLVKMVVTPTEQAPINTAAADEEL